MSNQLPRPQSIARRRSFIGILVVGGAFLIAACSSIPGLNGNTSGSDQSAVATSAVPVLSDACSVADKFLKAWENSDYPTMYSTISGHSQQYSKDQFTTVYTDAAKTMGPNTTLTHSLDCNKATQQGVTAIINYDMTFNSPLVGQFTDAGRVMRLSWGTHGWQIAWSTEDVFQQMVGGATLRLAYQTVARGTIYDRNGKVIASDGQTVYTGTIKTKAYNGAPENCFQELATVFRLRYIDVVKELKSLTGLDYGVAVGTLDAETYTNRHAELEAACPIVFSGRLTRSLFHGGLAVQTVGYVGAIPSEQQAKYAHYPPGALVGLAGIEEKYDGQLGGSPDLSLVIDLPDGTPLRTLATKSGAPAQNVRLTLDRDLQDATEQAIADAYNYAQPSWAQFSTGAAVVMIDIKTGAILSMASYPSFDADVFKLDTQLPVAQVLPKIANPSSQYARPALINLAVQEYSAPGSVFKIPSMAAALDSGLFKPDTLYDDQTGIWDGRKQFGDTLLRYDWIALDPAYKDVGNKHGSLTLVQALTASCDVCFWQVGATLNQKDSSLLSKYAQQLGLGQSTGLSDLPQSDLVGQIPSPANIGSIQGNGRSWAVGDALNEVIGQGDVKVTTLQIARMMAAISNGGTLWRPYLLQGVGSDNKVIATVVPQKQGTISLSQPELKAINQGLCGATTDKNIGTAEWFLDNWNFSRVEICGKTGTAQTGTAHPNGWFAAVAGTPGKPDIAVVVLVEHGREGSETAGPIARRIIEAYYHIPYNPWPTFWAQPYVPMADPNASDGGRPFILGQGK